jgi:hypothetical protein
MTWSNTQEEEYSGKGVGWEIDEEEKGKIKIRMGSLLFSVLLYSLVF